MRVLSIEDDSATAQSINLMLRSEGLRVQIAELGEEGLDMALIYDFDIILLDLNLPDMSGFEILRILRSRNIKTAVLILSGLAGIEDKVKGLGLGADDYMTKPFHKDELIARIHAVVRRCRGHASSLIEVGNLVIDIHAKKVKVDGREIFLTSKEYSVLELLALRAGSLVTKDMLLNHLYAGGVEPGIKIVDVFVCKIRKKIGGNAPRSTCIETVWGKGYMLRETPTESVAAAG